MSDDDRRLLKLERYAVRVFLLGWSFREVDDICVAPQGWAETTLRRYYRGTLRLVAGQ